jgi:hypothetical protein
MFISSALSGLVMVGMLAQAPAAETAGDPAPRPETQVSRERLLDELKALPTKRSPNGSDAHRDGLRRTEDLLLEKLRGLGYTPVTHEVDYLGAGSNRRKDAATPGAGGPDSSHAPKPWRNIIVELPGTTRPDEILVFSAHFDAVVKAPGADDDGTGTVALLEMARLLKDRPMQRTVRMIFFNLEEVGLVGSRAYVQSIESEIKGELDSAPPTDAKPATDAAPAPPADPPRKPPTKKFLGMVSADGIGYFTDEPNSQRSPIPETPMFKPPTVGDFIALGGIGRHRSYSQALTKAMRAAAPELKIVAVDWLPIAPPDLLRSDHAPFLAAGVPAVILADTANFRSPHYHQPTDTVDTLDMKRYTLVVQGLIGAAYTLAGPVGGELIALSPKKPTTPNGSPGAAAPAPDK